MKSASLQYANALADVALEQGQGEPTIAQLSEFAAAYRESGELRNILKDFPAYKLTVEGHCDERGSAEYNVALGAARAEAAKNYLVQVGIASDQLNVISYGKEKPACSESDENCWQKNRRIHIVAMAH